MLVKKNYLIYISEAETDPKKFSHEMYATFLWQNSLEKEVFVDYQLHVYEGKLPFQFHLNNH